MHNQWTIVMLVTAAALAMGCRESGVTQADGLSTMAQWEASSVLDFAYGYGAPDGDLVAQPTVTNSGSDSLIGWIGLGCAFEYFAYLNPDRNGTPVWHGPTGIRACPAMAVRLVAAPGETRRLAQEVVGAVREIMGGRPPATYYFAAVLLLYPDVDGSKAMRVGPVPAGQVYLGQK